MSTLIFSNHNPPMKGFGSPNVYGRRIWKHIASTFLPSPLPHLSWKATGSTIGSKLLPISILSTLLRQGILYLSPLCALLKYTSPPLTKWYLFSLLRKIASLSHKYGLPNIYQSKCVCFEVLLTAHATIRSLALDIDHANLGILCNYLYMANENKLSNSLA